MRKLPMFISNYTQTTMLSLLMHTNIWLNIGENLILYGVHHLVKANSKVRMMASKSGTYDAVMPDIKLWAEIIFLQNFTKNTNIKFVVENVKPYYEPFVKPTAKLGRHLFWANFEIPQ